MIGNTARIIDRYLYKTTTNAIMTSKVSKSSKTSKTSPFNYHPTQADVEKHTAKVNRQGGIHYQVQHLTEHFEKQVLKKGDDDIAFTFHQGLGQFNVYNKEEMKEQMILWKKLAKEGKINVYDYNNFESEVVGTKFYSLTITSNVENLCPLGMCLGFMVSGHTYAYTSKQNRDTIFDFIKKNEKK